MTTFGSRLKKIRTILGLSQEDLANRLNLTRSSISKCEKDKSFVSEQTLKTLAQEYKVNLNYLLAEIGEPIINNQNENEFTIKLKEFLKNEGII